MNKSANILLLCICLFIYSKVNAQHTDNSSNNGSTIFEYITTRNNNILIGHTISQKSDSVVFQDYTLGQISFSPNHIDKKQTITDSSFYEISLQNGNKLIGRIIKNESGILKIETQEYGDIECLAKSITELETIEIRELRKGKRRYPNPNYTRYLFAPSAFPMQKNEWYYQNAYVLANSANYGITNHITLGGGLFIPFVAYLTPKVGYSITPYLHAGIGSLYTLLPAFEDRDEQESSVKQIGLGYGLITVGNIEHNITGGVGYGYLVDDWMNSPVITICGFSRVGNRIAIVSENWIIPYKSQDFPRTEYSREILFSYGVRFLWENFAIDAAFIVNEHITSVLPIGIPYIDFAVKF